MAEMIFIVQLVWALPFLFALRLAKGPYRYNSGLAIYYLFDHGEGEQVLFWSGLYSFLGAGLGLIIAGLWHVSYFGLESKPLDQLADHELVCLVLMGGCLPATIAFLITWLYVAWIAGKAADISSGGRNGRDVVSFTPYTSSRS